MWFYPKDTNFKEYYSNLTQDLEFSLETPISNQLKKEAFKSSSNKILLNYLNRLRSRKSKKLKIYREAVKYATTNNIKLSDTRNVFESQLDANEVKKEKANPQLLKLVLDQLIKEKP